jgi:hypothetical protein
MQSIKAYARMGRSLVLVCGVALAAGAAARAEAATVKTQKPIYAANEKIVVEWTGVPAGQSAWVSVDKAGTNPANSYLAYQYTNDQVNGSREFGGLPIGQYEARAYGDGGYGKLLARYAFSVGDSAGTVIDWGTNPRDLNMRGKNGQRFTFICPANGTLRSAWGTDVYTDDSSIATAAVHSGLITVSQGGTVTIEIRPGQASYTGSTRNGVTSGTYGSWDGSYIFIRAGSPTIKTRQPSYTPNDNITVDYAGLPGNRQGWIGLAPAGMPDGQYQTGYGDVASGNPSDSRTFPALPAGQYEARAWVQGSDGQWALRARYGFTVNATTAATGSFDGIWSTDLDIGLYIGLVQNGVQVQGYYYASDGKWYPLLSGTVSNGNTLRGNWDSGIPWFSGEFVFALNGNKSFQAAATSFDGLVRIDFTGKFYAAWSR